VHEDVDAPRVLADLPAEGLHLAGPRVIAAARAPSAAGAGGELGGLVDRRRPAPRRDPPGPARAVRGRAPLTAGPRARPAGAPPPPRHERHAPLEVPVHLPARGSVLCRPGNVVLRVVVHESRLRESHPDEDEPTPPLLTPAVIYYRASSLRGFHGCVRLGCFVCSCSSRPGVV